MLSVTLACARRTGAAARVARARLRQAFERMNNTLSHWSKTYVPDGTVYFLYGLVVIDFTLFRSGDGMYVLSNGKDQTAKLWDLRKMMAGRVDCRGLVNRQTSNWDYRFMAYPVCFDWHAVLSGTTRIPKFWTH